jgi:hypothetical protein
MKSLSKGLTPTVKFRCPDPLYQAFKAKVINQGLNVSEVLRNLMLEYLKTS